MNPRRTIPCEIRKPAGFDRFGQPKAGAVISELVAVVKFSVGVIKSSVRTDSSATHGRAVERVFDVVLLFSKDSSVAIGDQLFIQGETMNVTGRHPRFSTRGALDHIRVEIKDAKPS